MSRLSLFTPITSTNFVNGGSTHFTRFVFNSGEFGIKTLQTGLVITLTHVEEKGFGADNLLNVTLVSLQPL